MPTSLVSTGVQFPDSTTQTTALPAPGSSGNLLTSNGTAWTSAAPAGGGNYTLLYNTTLGSAASSVNITGITNTYSYYRVLVYVPPTGSEYANTVRILLLDGSNNPLPSPTSTGRTYYATYTFGSELASSPYVNRDSSATNGFWTIANGSYAATDKNAFFLDFNLYKSPDAVRPGHWINGVAAYNQSTYPFPNLFFGGYGTYDTPTTTPSLRGLRLNNTSGGNFFVSGTSIQLWGWKTTG